MANKVWSGATNGDINNTGNWVGGAVPGASDVAVFNQGSQDADTNVTSPTAASWTGLTITSGYTGNIGSSGNKLTVSLTGAVKHSGSGQLWLEDSSGTTGDVFIYTGSANTVVDLGGNTMTNVNILRGTVTLAGTMGVITRLTIGRGGAIGDATVTFTSGMSAVTKCIMASGTATLNSTITTLEMAGGRLTAPVASSGTLTNVIQTGGVVKYHTTNTITDLYTVGGSFELGDDEMTVSQATHIGNLLHNPDLHTLTAEDDLSYMANP